MTTIKNFASVLNAFSHGLSKSQRLKKTMLGLGLSAFLLPFSLCASAQGGSYYYDNMGNGHRLSRDGDTGIKTIATHETWNAVKWEKVAIDATWFRLKNKKTGNYLNYPSCATGAAANQKAATGNTNKLKYENSRLIAQSCPNLWLANNSTLQNWTGPWAQWTQTSTATGGAGTTTHTMTVDNKQREFIVYVPDNVGAAAPVVFVLHGTGKNGQMFYDLTDWTSKADAEGIIAVFPSSLTYCYYNQGVLDVKTKWAAGALGVPTGFPLCSTEDIAGLTAAQQALIGNNSVADDLAFFDRMFSFLEANYPVDNKRYYVTGNSNGASMTLRLAAQRSTRFASAAANAGNMQLPFPMAARPMSTMLTVGNRDNFLSRAIDEPTPIGIREDLIFEPPLYADLQNHLNAQSLTISYTYNEQTLNGESIGSWLFNDSVVGASNRFIYVLIEDNTHDYPNDVIDEYWNFMSMEVLP